MADALLETDADAGPDVLARRGGVGNAAVAAPLHLGVAGDGQLGRDVAAALAEELLQREPELDTGEPGARARLEAKQALCHVANGSPPVPVGSERVAEVGPEAQPRGAEHAPPGTAAEIDDVGAGRGAEERNGGSGSERDLHGRGA